jgi:diguanylate cyclase (GGDEF)-like protein
MLEHIEKAIHSSWKTPQRPTVLFIDVDRFKSINDSLGHSTGDAILTEVARRLTGAISPQATVARIAGDEFVVLDSTTESPTQSVVLAERILDALRDPMKGNAGDMFARAFGNSSRCMCRAGKRSDTALVARDHGTWPRRSRAVSG